MVKQIGAVNQLLSFGSETSKGRRQDRLLRGRKGERHKALRAGHENQGVAQSDIDHDWVLGDPPVLRLGTLIKGMRSWQINVLVGLKPL